MLSPAAAGNQGQSPAMSPLGQGRALCPVAPKGIVLRASTLNTEDKGHQQLSLLAPLGFYLLGNATVAFAQTSDAPGVPGCCRVASVAKWCSWQPQACWDGGPRHRFLLATPPVFSPHPAIPLSTSSSPPNPAANPLPSNKAPLTRCQRLKYRLYFRSQNWLPEQPPAETLRPPQARGASASQAFQPGQWVPPCTKRCV